MLCKFLLYGKVNQIYRYIYVCVCVYIYIRIYVCIYIYIYICIYVYRLCKGSLGRDDSLEEGTATHSSILAWRIPRTEEPGRLRSIGSQRVGYD